MMNEYKKDANKRLAKACRITALVSVIVMILNFTGVFIIGNIIYPVLIFSIFVLFTPTVLYDIMKSTSKGSRYFVLTIISLMTGVLYSVLSYHVTIILIFPVVISSIYCERKLVWYTTLIGIPVMAAAHFAAFALKVVPDEPLVTIKGVILYGIIPRTLEYLAVAMICISASGKLQKLISALENKNDELYEDQLSIITSLSTMIESESKETGEHAKRVSEYTAILLKHLGMNEEEVWKVSLAAMMHDVGKILVPHEILEKPGKLTDDEFRQIKKHTIYGKRMLADSPAELMQISSIIAYEHHERYDGKGYAGIVGEEIHIYARCVSIADVFDALVSWRPYKKPWALEDARKEIVRNGGTQFDPNLVIIFDEHFEEFVKVFKKYPDSVESVETDLILKD